MGHSLVILLWKSFPYIRTSNSAAALLPYWWQIWLALVYQYVFILIRHSGFCPRAITLNCKIIFISISVKKKVLSPKT